MATATSKGSVAGPMVHAAPALCGAWATGNIVRRYRAEKRCTRFTRLSPQQAEHHLNKREGCDDLVDAHIFDRLPLVKPSASACGGAFSHHHQRDQCDKNPSHGSIRRTTKVFPADVATSSETVITSSIGKPTKKKEAPESLQSIKQLRRDVWSKREELTQANNLSRKTGNKRNDSNVKRLRREVDTLSAHLLDRIRSSKEFRHGFFDLHGLTRKEAVEIVESKLNTSGDQPFQVITGKGLHSKNGIPVLIPALEKYLKSRGVKSTYHDGVMSVIPTTPVTVPAEGNKRRRKHKQGPNTKAVLK